MPSKVTTLSSIDPFSCKAQRNLNCFFAVIMGLNAAAVGRLTQTWEVRMEPDLVASSKICSVLIGFLSLQKIPGKFKKLFSELETMTVSDSSNTKLQNYYSTVKVTKTPYCYCCICGSP